MPLPTGRGQAIALSTEELSIPIVALKDFSREE
jgi:hypothetical protein